MMYQTNHKIISALSNSEVSKHHLVLLIAILFSFRPTANLDEPRGRHMPPDSWRTSSPRSMVPNNQYNNFGSDNFVALTGSTVTSSADTVWFKSTFCYNSNFIFNYL
jgi:hypothetical protein